MGTFELVIGNMGSGKTTYAKSLANRRFISYDDELEKTRWHWKPAFQNIVASLNSQPESNFAIDGWFSVYNLDPQSVIELQAAIPQKVRITAFYTPLHYLQQANEKNTKKLIWEVYDYIMRFYRNELANFEFRFRDRERAYTFEEFSYLVRRDMVDVTPGDVDNFLAFLERQTHDRYYQTIDLPFGRKIHGYERTELTWDILRTTVGWRGKTVIDIGSYHGYTDFGAVDQGAKYLLGIDKTLQAVRIANKLKAIWHYQDIDFIRADIDLYNPKNHFDVALCLNTVQYFSNLLPSLTKIFNAADLVIFEAYEEYRPLLDEAASKTGHRFIREFESPRWRDLRRVLYFYEPVT